MASRNAGPSTVSMQKNAKRKSVPHRVNITKGDNGGYVAEVQSKYADAKDEWGDRPPTATHAFANHKDMMNALPEMFGEQHPSTKPAKTQGGDEELPE